LTKNKVIKTIILVNGIAAFGSLDTETLTFKLIERVEDYFERKQSHEEIVEELKLKYE